MKPIARAHNRDLKSQLQECSYGKEPNHDMPSCENKTIKEGELRVKSSTKTDTDTNLWARSKTQLHTRGYKSSEVLVSLSCETCDHSLRF